MSRIMGQLGLISFFETFDKYRPNFTLYLNCSHDKEHNVPTPKAPMCLIILTAVGLLKENYN